MIEIEDDEQDGWALPPLEDGRVRIMRERCSTCIFRPGNRMSLQRGRVASMLADVRRDDSFVTCHKTLGTGKPGAICRGSSDAYESTLEQVARRLGLVVEVDGEEVE